MYGRSVGVSSTVSGGGTGEPVSEGEGEGAGELQMAALRATSALLTCGPCFDSQALSEDGFLYQWLDAMLGSKDNKVGEERPFI